MVVSARETAEARASKLAHTALGALRLREAGIAGTNDSLPLSQGAIYKIWIQRILRYPQAHDGLTKQGEGRRTPISRICGHMNESLIIWPLVIAIEDCFVPQSAAMIIKDVSKFDEFTCGLFIHLRVIRADNKLWDQRN